MNLGFDFGSEGGGMLKPRCAINSAVGIGVAVLLIAMIGEGATISVGPGGNIQAAIDSAVDGDVVLVKSGVYRETLNIYKEIKLIGDDIGSGKPVIDGGRSEDGIRLFAENVTVRDFEVTNARIGIDVTSKNNTIIYNEVRDSWTGIALHSSANNLLKGNVVRDSWRGIYLKGSNENVVSENTVRDNRWSGIVIESSNENDITDNLIQSNYRGFEISDSGENTFIGNELTDNYHNDEPPSGSSKGLADIVGAPGVKTPAIDAVEASEAIEKVTEEHGETPPSGGNGSAEETASSSTEPLDEGGLNGAVSEVKDPKLDDDSLGPDGDEIDDLAPRDGIYLHEDDPSSRYLTSGPSMEKDEGTGASALEPEPISPEPSTSASGPDSAAESTAKSALERGGPRIAPIDELDPVEPDRDESVLRPAEEETATREPPEGADPMGELTEELHPIEPERDASAPATGESEVESPENETAGDATTGEDATRGKSSSGGWWKYELSRLLGNMTGGKKADLSPPSEMNLPEMAEAELEDLDLGTISFYSPKEMTVGASAKVEAAVAKDVQQELASGLRDRGVNEEEVAKLKVSVSSDLRGNSFRIQPIPMDPQASDGISRWSWEVTPLKSGLHDLTLEVHAVVELDDGVLFRRDYPPVERRVGVDLSMRNVVLYIVDRVTDLAES